MTILFSSSGWDARSALLQCFLDAKKGPPHHYADLLILVPSLRLKRMYGRALLDLAFERGTSALVPPVILTPHHFYEQLYAKLEGPRVLEETSRLVLLEGLVKESLAQHTPFNQQSDLLAPSLSSAMAGMIELLATAGLSPVRFSGVIKGSPFSDRPQTMMLADIYDRYDRALRDLGATDPAGMITMLLDQFDPAWFSGITHIILDGIVPSAGSEARLLKKITAAVPCTLLLHATTPELVNSAGVRHPLRPLRDFLTVLGITPIDASSTDEDEHVLARSLFSERPFEEVRLSAPCPKDFTRGISTVSAINRREEVSFIARQIKASLRSGRIPDTILVSFPALDQYGPLVEEIFSDFGIPYNRSLGRQLSSSPVTGAVIALLGACQDGFSGPSLLRIFSSPFLKFAAGAPIASALDRLMRTRGITGGIGKLLAVLANPGGDVSDNSDLSSHLRDLEAALTPFMSQGPAPLLEWMRRLDNLMAWAMIAERVNTIPGALNINLQAHRRLQEATASLTRAGTLLSRFSYSFDEWLFLLKTTFMHARFQVPPEDEGGVQVLGLGETAGLPWQEIYLGGLVDSDFPQRLPPNIFLPEPLLEELGVRTRTTDRLAASGQFYRLVLSAGRVTLTRPESTGDQPLSASPFLGELQPLLDAGLVSSRSGEQFSLSLQDSCSSQEFAKAAALVLDPASARELAGRLPESNRTVLAAFVSPSANDLQPLPKVDKSAFSVTELDDYLRCPYDYFVKNVLNLRPLEEVTDDLTPGERGSKVHRILHTFYRTWRGPVTRETRDAALLALGRIIDDSFSCETDTVRNRREWDVAKSVMAVRFLDAEEAFWQQGFMVSFLEQEISSPPISLQGGRSIVISGKVDRIDAGPDGRFIIVDYKTGKYPEPKKGLDQEIFQLPLYAVLAENMPAGDGPRLSSAIGLAYYDLAGKRSAHARDVVLYDQDRGMAHPCAKPQSSPKSADDFRAILRMSLDKAIAAAEGILSGSFPPLPRDRNTCRYCLHMMMCPAADDAGAGKDEDGE